MQQPLRTAIYARVSSEPQTDGNSMASQIAALEARVAADGLRLPAAQRFVDDGYSGATLARPASSSCATLRRLVGWIGFTFTRRIAWPGATPTKCCWLTSCGAPGWRSSS